MKFMHDTEVSLDEQTSGYPISADTVVDVDSTFIDIVNNLDQKCSISQKKSITFI